MWRFFHDDDEQRDYLLEDSQSLCSLSPAQQRIYGFAALLLAGLVFMLLSLVVFAKPIKFALLFTFGNVLAVGSTALLIGTRQQLRMMFDADRVYATAVYVGSVIVALVCALLIHSKILTVVAIICEICALFWYSLSYIPFARRMLDWSCSEQRTSTFVLFHRGFVEFNKAPHGCFLEFIKNKLNIEVSKSQLHNKKRSTREERETNRMTYPNWSVGAFWCKQPFNERVAIVGSEPTGLAADHLNKNGFVKGLVVVRVNGRRMKVENFSSMKSKARMHYWN
ncbi:Got1/Sft2-like vescicle transport protein family [Striga hermonthica]|uniref:Vesicle transport protein n=1 Tax=Striga hermonthica TaxID=68872 RepID=A0A9N7NAP0_STRHE|nr:Got1/Sft2-like vescicle transport protein family [Striga hermonthica]